MAKTTSKKAKQSFKIIKRGDGRFEIKKRGGGNINGADKLKILAEAGLVKLKTAKAKPAEEAPAQG